MKYSVLDMIFVKMPIVPTPCAKTSSESKLFRKSKQLSANLKGCSILINSFNVVRFVDLFYRKRYDAKVS